MSNIKTVIEFILKNLDLAQVMLDYDVKFVYNPFKLVETQYHCPFHGKDSKPSARYYRDTQSSYCWVCNKAWDVIEFIKQKEGLDFRQTLDFIIKKYKFNISLTFEQPEFSLIKNEPEIRKLDFSVFQYRIRRLKGKIDFKDYNTLFNSLYILKMKYFLNKINPIDVNQLQNLINKYE